MIVLQAHEVSKSFAGVPILESVSIQIQSHSRIGLVGRNGSGKSTLLQILMGSLEADEGEIFRSRSTRVGYLAQDNDLASNKTIWDEMRTVFSDLIAEEKRLRKLEEQMADKSVITDQEQYDSLMTEYASASDAFKHKGGYQYEATIRTVLHGLRFYENDYERQIGTLSGGQKTRLALAKLLLEKPDVLILDEPTNYLDLETLSWLEQYLKHYEGAIFVVSHDRYFLDALVQEVYELEYQHIRHYHGNYSTFLERKAARLEQEWKMYRKQQQEKAEMEDFIQRNIARASTSNRAKSKRKQLEKMDEMDRPTADTKTATFRFDIDRRSGNDVLQVQDVAIGYEQHAPICSNIQLHVYREDRIAILGPNGIGKTTLLSTVIGQQPPLSGTIRYGTNVQMAYYDQEQTTLHPHKTVLHEIWDDYPHMRVGDVRSLLGQFLFSGEEVDKSVASLSGGERARLSLAKLMLVQANLLILDEPTNHLDIYSKEVLEKALAEYPGTIVFVSHDRYFINQIATKIVELSSHGTKLYLGDYDYYVFKKQEEAEWERINSVSNETESTDKQEAQQSYEEQKAAKKEARRLERKRNELETRIYELEETINTLEQQLLDPQTMHDYAKATEIQQQVESLSAERDEVLEQWTVLEEKA